MSLSLPSVSLTFIQPASPLYQYICNELENGRIVIAPVNLSIREKRSMIITNVYALCNGEFSVVTDYSNYNALFYKCNRARVELSVIENARIEMEAME